MKRVFGYSGIFLSLFILVGSSYPAKSVSIQIGIDKGFEEFLERYSKELREQLLQLIKDARPEIDKSVLTYLTKIDAIIRIMLI